MRHPARDRYAVPELAILGKAFDLFAKRPVADDQQVIVGDALGQRAEGMQQDFNPVPGLQAAGEAHDELAR